jgi:hypothetical protein
MAQAAGYTNGQTSVVAPVAPSGEAGERQERRGPERGTAVREEQGPEGRTPWTLRSRRASRGAAGSKPSRRYSNLGDGRCRGPEVTGRTRPAEVFPETEHGGRAACGERPAGMCRRGRNPRRAVRRAPGNRERRGELGTRDSKDGPSAGPLTVRALARAEPAIGKTPGRREPRRGSTEPDRCYRSAGAMKRRLTSKEDGHPAVTRGRQCRRTRKALEGARERERIIESAFGSKMKNCSRTFLHPSRTI